MPILEWIGPYSLEAGNVFGIKEPLAGVYLWVSTYRDQSGPFLRNVYAGESGVLAKRILEHCRKVLSLEYQLFSGDGTQISLGFCDLPKILQDSKRLDDATECAKAELRRSEFFLAECPKVECPRAFRRTIEEMLISRLLGVEGQTKNLRPRIHVLNHSEERQRVIPPAKVRNVFGRGD